MPESLMKLTFRSRPDRLKVVRASIHAAARACGFDDVEAQDIVLAVDEACANVIVHAYDWQEDSDIVIDIFKLDDGIRVQLRDFAETVDPSAIEPRKPDARTPGGLGRISFPRSWTRQAVRGDGRQGQCARPGQADGGAVMPGAVTERAGKLVVTLDGAVDLDHAPAVRAMLLDCVGRKQGLVVDLSAVEYIDSSGIANLVETLQAAQQTASISAWSRSPAR